MKRKTYSTCVLNVRKALGTPKATAIEVELAGAAAGGQDA